MRARGGRVKEGGCEIRKAESRVAVVVVGVGGGRDWRRREKRRVKESAAGLPCK